YKLSNQKDLDHFKENWDGETVYFFEQFVASKQVCTYDGLVDSQGNVVFETSFNYRYAPLELLTHNRDNAYYVLDKIDP
ncbi:ATP-grasp domain-containing protein, partial [Streptococcus pyogenes]